MSEQERFLVTFDSARGVPVRVEQVGEAGELTEVSLAGFLRRLTSGPAAGAPQQIVINIYGGGPQGARVVTEDLPWHGIDKPPAKPPRKPGRPK